MPQSVDVAIVGGGIVGCSLALSLADAGLEVCLLSAADGPQAGARVGDAPQPVLTNPSGGRPIALAKASQRLFANLKVWGQLAPMATPIAEVHVSQAHGFGVTKLRASEFALDALGYVLRSDELEQVLTHACEVRAEGRVAQAASELGVQGAGRLTLVRPATVSAAVATPSGMRVAFDGPAPGEERALEAGLVALAHGYGPGLHESLGVEERRMAFEQSVLVTEVICASDHGSTAFERFLREGPLALLPLGARRFAVVWTGLASRLEALCECSDKTFTDALEVSGGGRFQVVSLAAERRVVPLTGVRRTQSPSSHFVLLGNAAQTLHPVAGQGLNLGLRDVAVLSDLCARALLDGPISPAASIAKRFLSARQQDRRVTAASTDFLARAFTWGGALGTGIRACGLLGLELLPWTKRALARQATGLAPPVPRAMRAAKADNGRAR